MNLSLKAGGEAPSFGRRLRIAAIRFLNPAPLMWDFEHEPRKSDLAHYYSVEWMMPSTCADRLALPIDDPESADLGLVPVAAVATTPGLRIVPGCAIASKRKVRSIILVRRAGLELAEIRTIAADTSSRASLAYLQIMAGWWSETPVRFVSHAPQLDEMLKAADAAMLIGDPALFALEDRVAREERTGEKLVYLDLAEEWTAVLDVPWVSAVWAIREESLIDSGRTMESIASDLNRSRDTGLDNIEAIVAEWSAKLPLPESTVREYLTSNIFYYLDEECLEGLRHFYKLAEEANILPVYNLDLRAI